MAIAARLSVEILTGFLGSGKTTLLNHFLNSGLFDDTAVIVNELGEIGLDHLLVSDRAGLGEVALLEGGCLCCTVVDSLPETLLELCRQRAAGDLPPFKRIVIETTGLADPVPIREVIRSSPLLAHFLTPGLIVTALDMLSHEQVIARHPDALRQLLHADRIILTKLDLRSPASEAELAGIAALNPFAEVASAQAMMENPERLLAPPATHAGSAANHIRPSDTAARHSHGVRAYSFPIDTPATRAGLAAFAAAAGQRFGDRLLRCKGIVTVGGRPMLIQGVGMRFAFERVDHLPADLPPHITCIVQDCDETDVKQLLIWLHVPEGTPPPVLENMK